MDKNIPNNRSIGLFGEDAACEYLALNSYIIKDRNFRVGKMGELDIIALYGDTLCFIEVKSRKSLAYGTPAESLIPSKIRNIQRLASIYLKNHGLSDIPVRFDVIEVYLTQRGNQLTIKEIAHIRDAF